MGSLVSVVEVDGLAWVTLDNPPVNATSAAVRQELAQAVEEVAALRTSAAILRCAGRTFVAGGDITEFDAAPIPPDLPDVVRLIEACEVPWIAALHGSAFGGGLEIALGCAWRVAVSGTRLALPEVTLGIVPGAGGTQRLPRLVGVDLALRMATTGAPVTAEDFHTAGGLDAILPDLEKSTLEAFARGVGVRPRAVSSRKVVPQSQNWWTGKTAQIALEAHGAIAPLENADLIAKSADIPFDEGQRLERSRHLELRVSPQSRALRHMFFAQRDVARLPAPVKTAKSLLSGIALPGSDPLADWLTGEVKRSGLNARREIATVDEAEVVVLTGSGSVEDLRDLRDRVMMVRDVEHGGTVPPEAADVAIGLDRGKARLGEIRIQPDAPEALVGQAFALTKRLGFIPFLSRGSGPFLVSRLRHAVEQFIDQSDASNDRFIASWEAFGGQGAALANRGDRADGAGSSHPDPEAAPDRVLRGLLAVLINQGALALEEGCVEQSAAIDVISVQALGFPRWRGGAFHYADSIGVAQVSDWMEEVMKDRPGMYRLSRMLRRGAT